MEKGKIFISYRREDTSGESGRLKDKLEQVFGKENIFYDVETLEPGLNFDQSIAKALSESKVLLAMIGPHWLKVSDSKGVKRLQKPEDWVRKEIAEAIKRGLRVIPILVNGADMPDSEELPDDLKELSLKHAQELTSSRWNYDVGELSKVLEKIITKKPEPKPEPQSSSRVYVPPIPKTKSWWAKNYLWVLGGFVGFLFLINRCFHNQTAYDPIIETDSVTQADLSTEDPGRTENYESLTLNNGNEKTEENPIYNSLLLDETTSNSSEAEDPVIPDFSGKWWLRENGIRAGYLQIIQNGTEFSFRYYLFNVEVGRGLGAFEDYNLYSTQFEIDENPGVHRFAFASGDNGQTWIGHTESDSAPAEATLSRN